MGQKKGKLIFVADSDSYILGRIDPSQIFGDINQQLMTNLHTIIIEIKKQKMTRTTDGPTDGRTRQGVVATKKHYRHRGIYGRTNRRTYVRGCVYKLEYAIDVLMKRFI